MSSMADRMALSESILALIDRKRAETGDPALGSAIERALLENQFRDIETDIMEDPGAFEPWLIRRRDQNLH